MAVVPNGVEALPKISIAWVECRNVTDRRQTDRPTDGRWHSEREREFTTSRLLISSILQIYVRGARSRLSLRARRDHDPALHYLYQWCKASMPYFGLDLGLGLEVFASALKFNVAYVIMKIGEVKLLWSQETVFFEHDTTDFIISCDFITFLYSLRLLTRTMYTAVASPAMRHWGTCTLDF